MIKNIICDMGNVLLRYDPEESLNKFCADDEEKDIIRRELFQSEDWLAGDRGIIRESEKFDLVKARIPEKYLPALKNCCENWDICMKPLSGAVEFCKWARENGYRLFVLSNASDSFYKIFPHEIDTALFEGFVVSSDVKLIKPDERIYLLLLEKFSLKAEECLFLDDNEENVSTAEKLGIKSIVFTGDFTAVMKMLKRGN